MTIGVLTLLMLAAIGFALWQARPAAGAPWRVAAAMLMAAGALITLFAGLASLLGVVLLVGWARQTPGFGHASQDLILAAMPIGGFLLTALGVWIYRRGRARLRADAHRD